MEDLKVKDINVIETKKNYEKNEIIETGKKEEKPKKKDTKVFALFILFIFISGIMGYFLGGLFRELSKKDAFDALKPVVNGLAIMCPWIFMGVNVIGFLVSFVSYKNANKRFAKCSEDDEDEIFKIEGILNVPMILAGLGLIINFFFFSSMMQVIDTTKYGKDHMKFLYVFMIVIFIFGMIWQLFIQAKTIDLEKKLNPEKKGNIFDSNFSKDWENSCDEAEKAKIYKSGYKAFKVAVISCMVMWIISVFGQLFFNTGLLPCITLTVIWLSMTIAYYVEAVK